VVRATATAFVTAPSPQQQQQQQQQQQYRSFQSLSRTKASHYVPSLQQRTDTGSSRLYPKKSMTRLYDTLTPPPPPSQNNTDLKKVEDQNNNNNNNDKFGWSQRWASVQSLILGAVVGSIATAPISLFHNLVILHTIINPWAQWEYDTDSNAIIGGLFAIIYRYCIRQDGEVNPQLKQGCISAMILIRTLPQIQIPAYCTAFPLNCHHDNVISRILFPMSYIFDDGIIVQQLFWSGLESTILFTVTAQMMDQAMKQQYIRSFPG
jgi:hypothetical protein